MNEARATAHIDGEALISERLRQVLGRCGVVMAEPTQAADILILADMTSERLEARLDRPYRAFIEARPEDETLAQRIRTADGRFSLTLTTPTAFTSVDTARLVCHALAQRGGVPASLRDGIELALQETIANAILHGNLGLSRDGSTDVEVFQQFCERLHDRLAHPEAARRWLTITATWNADQVEIAVNDEGEGYTPKERGAIAQGNGIGEEGLGEEGLGQEGLGEEGPGEDEIEENGGACGRGMAIVRMLASAVTVSKGGRCTTLCFTLDPP